MAEWEYRCDICKVSFRTRGIYEKHLNEYNEDPKHKKLSTSLEGVTEAPSHQFHI